MYGSCSRGGVLTWGGWRWGGVGDGCRCVRACVRAWARACVVRVGARACVQELEAAAYRFGVVSYEEGALTKPRPAPAGGGAALSGGWSGSRSPAAGGRTAEARRAALLIAQARPATSLPPRFQELAAAIGRRPDPSPSVASSGPAACRLDTRDAA